MDSSLTSNTVALPTSRVRGASPIEFTRTADEFQRMVDVRLHNRGRNTNESDTRTFELRLTGCIGSPVFGRVMDGAVHLNCETQLTAIEIEDEPPDGMLTPELETVQAPVTQAIPEDRLGRR